MAGQGDPPEGTPDGPPAGGDDEYRSVVFDESFIRAARLKEYSAQERMGEHAHAVRSVRGFGAGPPGGGYRSAYGSGPRQILALFMLVALAFATAVYLGLRQPYRTPGPGAADQLRMTVVPLAPSGTVPGGTPRTLLARSRAADFPVGASGITLPPPVATGHFTASEVVAALSIVKEYLVASSLDPDVLMGRDRQSVRLLLDPEETDQFDRSFAAPADDGRYDPSGWLVGFDPAKVRQAQGAVRVQGSLAYQEASDQALEVTSDHTFVYALRPAGTAATGAPPAVTATPAADDASLFTVRRELHFRFDQEDLLKHRVQLVQSEVAAGPEACSAAAAKTFVPLLAGRRAPAGSPTGTDPFAAGHLAAGLCGSLTETAVPSPAAS
jgi:hypothetical protein